ncbi:methyl-accepting chemotaxis protein [Paenibacillus sp. yr247]|uniref:methyl-accepting chemotaxis protein n=1 Tax=Paenibacillus sp. yr247 TaxID=1761880 RepID=UPI000B868FAA|nr:methyl-accepting chemotaxis protein [Paenibacillus sp. yr247]
MWRIQIPLSRTSFIRYLRSPVKFQGISAASQQIAASSEEAAATFTEISSITKHSFERFETISDFSQDQLQSIEQLTNQAYVLNQMSQSLRLQIGRFTA